MSPDKARLSYVAGVRLSAADAADLRRFARTYRRSIEMYRAGRIKPFASIRDRPEDFARVMGGSFARWQEWATQNTRRGRDPFPLETLCAFVSATAVIWRSAGGSVRGWHYDAGRGDWHGPLLSLIEELIAATGLGSPPSRISIKRALEATLNDQREAAEVESAVAFLDRYDRPV